MNIPMLVFFMVIFLMVQPVSSQDKPSTQRAMQAQMLEAINELNKQILEREKQLAEAKKNNEEEKTIKELEDQIVLLKKQVAMMGVPVCL